jgi:hypothetical protein
VIDDSIVRGTTERKHHPNACPLVTKNYRCVFCSSKSVTPIAMESLGKMGVLLHFKAAIELLKDNGQKCIRRFTDEM